MQRWLLAMKTKPDMRIVLLATDATVRGYSQQVNVLCHVTVVFSSLFRVCMGKEKPGKSWNFIISFSRARKVLKMNCESWKVMENELRINRQKIKS